MNIAINHRCGTITTWYAPDSGGYVRQTTDARPGTLGTQPTIDGATLTCGRSERSLRKTVRRYLRHQSGGEYGTCACGRERGHA